MRALDVLHLARIWKLRAGLELLVLDITVAAVFAVDAVVVAAFAVVMTHHVQQYLRKRSPHTRTSLNEPSMSIVTISPILRENTFPFTTNVSLYYLIK